MKILFNIRSGQFQRVMVICGLSLLAFSSCKKEEKEEEDGVGRLRLRLVPTFMGEPFVKGEIYSDTFGNRLRVDQFRTYLSNAVLIGSDGGELPLFDINLFTLDEYQTVAFEVPPGDYDGFHFSVGVPENLNKDQDPTQYPNNHPLSVAGAQGMFWEWNTGYVFIKLEGKADTLGVEGNPLLHPFAFHCGEDVLFRSHAFNDLDLSIKDIGTTTRSLYFPVDQFFYGANDTINLREDYLTHTSGNLDLAVRFTDLFNEALRFE